jgi:hypothetical protein
MKTRHFARNKSPVFIQVFQFSASAAEQHIVLPLYRKNKKRSRQGAAASSVHKRKAPLFFYLSPG